MGHTHNFQSSGWGCQILPWSWDSKSRLIGIYQGGRYKRGVSSENQVWEGQNGAMRRRRALLTFTLHSTAGISFIGGNAYRLTFGHGWANASMPRVVHIVLSDYDMMLPENGEKIHQSQEDSPEFQAAYVLGKELSCPFPACRSAFEDRTPARHWCVCRDHMAMVDRTHSHPALEKSGVPPL